MRRDYELFDFKKKFSENIKNLYYLFYIYSSKCYK